MHQNVVEIPPVAMEPDLRSDVDSTRWDPQSGGASPALYDLVQRAGREVREQWPFGGTPTPLNPTAQHRQQRIRSHRLYAIVAELRSELINGTGHAPRRRRGDIHTHLALLNMSPGESRKCVKRPLPPNEQQKQ